MNVHTVHRRNMNCVGLLGTSPDLMGALCKLNNLMPYFVFQKSSKISSKPTWPQVLQMKDCEFCLMTWVVDVLRSCSVRMQLSSVAVFSWLQQCLVLSRSSIVFVEWPNESMHGWKDYFQRKNIKENKLETHFEISNRGCCSGKPGSVARASPTMGICWFGWAMNSAKEGNPYLSISIFKGPVPQTSRFGDSTFPPSKPCVHLGIRTQIESSADTLARHHHAPLIKNASESVEQINQYFWLLSQQGYFTKQSAR